MKKLITCIFCVLLAIIMVACVAKEANNYTKEIEYINELIATAPMSSRQAENALLALNYSEKDIEIILDKADVNWGYQAYRVVIMELDVGPQSKAGLTKILEGLGFSKEEIQYGINTAEVNWKDQCLYAAMNYIEQGLTREQVGMKILADGFTEGEWNYVISRHYDLL